MQPPPFESPGMPMQKRKSPLPWIILGGVVVCCIGPMVLLGGGAFVGLNAAKPIIGCTIAMSGLSSAMEEYTKANGGKLPPAATWQKDIAPYYDKVLKGEDAGPFTIPQSNAPFECDAGSKTAIAFNTEFAGKKLADIKDKDAAIILFETSGTPAMNKSAAYKDPGKASSPKIMGNPRGWFAMNAEFETISIEDGRQKPMGGSSGFKAGRSNR